MSTSGARRKSKLALRVAGTTLQATPPSSLVRFTDVTAPCFRWGFDCSLWSGEPVKKRWLSLLLQGRRDGTHLQATSPLPLLLTESQD